ncbi:hypothetical protein GW17_00026263 [Ensete ventricosum]|nr:hypothetical protein GW17_00026263 [Ensete ventricosum]
MQGRLATAMPRPRPPTRERLAKTRASPQGAVAASSAGPARGCRPRPALPPAGATTPATGVAPLGRAAAGGQGQPRPSQGQWRRQRRRGGKGKARVSFY